MQVKTYRRATTTMTFGVCLTLLEPVYHALCRVTVRSGAMRVRVPVHSVLNALVSVLFSRQTAPAKKINKMRLVSGLSCWWTRARKKIAYLCAQLRKPQKKHYFASQYFIAITNYQQHMFRLPQVPGW